MRDFNQPSHNIQYKVSMAQFKLKRRVLFHIRVLLLLLYLLTNNIINSIFHTLII